MAIGVDVEEEEEKQKSKVREVDVNKIRHRAERRRQVEPVRSGPRRLPRKAASYQDMPTALGELLLRASRNFDFRSQSV